jgi:hypothetical protein
VSSQVQGVKLLFYRVNIFRHGAIRASRSLRGPALQTSRIAHPHLAADTCHALEKPDLHEDVRFQRIPPV